MYQFKNLKFVLQTFRKMSEFGAKNAANMFVGLFDK